MQKTHWRKAHNPNYLGSWDFQPGEIRQVTIKEIKTESVKNIDGKSEDCQVCYFVENYKPLILNSTNSRAIERLAKTPYIEDWKGTKLNLEIQKVKAFGDIVDAIRISKKAATITLPELTPQHPKWSEAIKAVKSGRYPIDMIRLSYLISDENYKLLQA
jgi:hypothetical protein